MLITRSDNPRICMNMLDYHTQKYITLSTLPAIIALCGSASRSVSVVCLNDPVRVNVVPLSLKATETDSFSRFCFFSKQIAKAQPTA